MSLVLRDGGAGDHAGLAELWRAAWLQISPEIDFSARLPFIRDQLAQSLAGRYRLRIACADGRPAGFTLVEPGTALLEQIAVAPVDWGTGAADALIRDALAAAGTALWLVVNQFNARAIRFYGRHGFAITGESVNAAGRPTYIMRQELQSAANWSAASRA